MPDRPPQPPHRPSPRPVSGMPSRPGQGPDPQTDGPPLPFNAIAPVVLVLALAMAAVEIALSLADAGLVGGPAGIGWRMQAVQDWGFSALVWDQVVDLGNRTPEMLRRFVTYGLVHGSFTHALFGIAMTLALGKFVGDLFAWWAVMAVFLGGLIVGAAVFGLVLDGPRPLFGSYPGVYALIGAFTYMIWLRLGEKGENRLRAFRMIGFLMVLQLSFGVIFGTDWSWIAELSGFAAGFSLSAVVSPGGLQALRARLRTR